MHETISKKTEDLKPGDLVFVNTFFLQVKAIYPCSSVYSICKDMDDLVIEWVTPFAIIEKTLDGPKAASLTDVERLYNLPVYFITMNAPNFYHTVLIL